MKKTHFLIVLFTLITSLPVQAHHVLGRPSYSLGEDSNTPPSMEVETQIGDYYITYMVFPAFPRPNEQGRVNVYATRIEDGAPFQGEVTFKVRDDSWFSRHEETLGTQPPDDNVFRQGFVFKQDGDYIISAQFEAGGAPYIIDFPLRIGNPPPIGPLGLTFATLGLLLIAVNIKQRRRLGRLKAKRHQDEARG